MRNISSNRAGWLVLAVALAMFVAGPRAANAQGNPAPNSFKFNSGQGVQPIFEGWARNPDGTFSMYFGYVNRNYVETLSIPVGNDNKFEPGNVDSGQPTFFDTRIHHLVFSVSVPSDWGKKELVWTVTAHGATGRAVAWLQPEWEIDPVYGGKERDAESLKNKAPALTVRAPSTVSMSGAATLSATVVDDGLPVPKAEPRKAAVGQETPPTLKPDPNQPEILLNVPQVSRPRPRAEARGLMLTWMVWRGPANVAFEPASTPVKSGKADVKATFNQPGTYVLRATADDGELHVSQDVTVIVTATAGQ